MLTSTPQPQPAGLTPWIIWWWCGHMRAALGKLGLVSWVAWDLVACDLSWRPLCLSTIYTTTTTTTTTTPNSMFNTKKHLYLLCGGHNLGFINFNLKGLVGSTNSEPRPTWFQTAVAALSAICSWAMYTFLWDGVSYWIYLSEIAFKQIIILYFLHI